jgi:hypothetical protein
MLNTLSPAFVATPPVRQVRGQYLAKNHLSPRARAELAAELAAGRVEIVDHTKQQAAFLCRVSVSSIKNVGKSAPRNPAPARALLDLWHYASPEQRQDFIRAAGTDSIWNELNSAL